MGMFFLVVLVALVCAAICVTILEKIWSVIRGKLGWKTSILNEELMDCVAKAVSTRYVDRCKATVEDADDASWEDIRQKFEGFAKEAIEVYAIAYCQQ